MRNLALCFCGVLVVALYASCSSEEYFITLDKIDSSLAKYKGKTMYDAFIEEKNRIEYEVLHHPKYDSLFYNSAKIKGYMQELEYILHNLAENVIKVDEVRELIKFLRRKAPDFIKTAKTMISTAKSLNPQSDFTGFDALKVPEAVSAIANAVDNLTEAIEKIPEILEELTKFIE